MNHFEDYTVIDRKFDYTTGEQYCWRCHGSLDDDEYVEVIENATNLFYYHVACYLPRPGQSAPTNEQSAAVYSSEEEVKRRLFAKLMEHSNRIKTGCEALSAEVVAIRALQGDLATVGVREEADVPQGVYDELLAAQEAYDAFEREYAKT